MATVSRLCVTPVKGLALLDRDEVELTRTGVPDNRRFYLLNEHGKLFNGTKDGPLYSVRSATDADGEHLRLEFEDGRIVEGPVSLGRRKFTAFWGRPVWGNVVEGPWVEALSELIGKPVLLMRAEDPGGAFDDSPVSLLSDASLEELARRSGAAEVDARRFRMLVHLAGTEPHEEDTWIGRHVRIGETVVDVIYQDARCRMTTRNPDTGVKDFDTVREIKGYRGLREGKYADFGVYANVVEPGPIRVGDPVEPV